jgi:hypothetical protein
VPVLLVVMASFDPEVAHLPFDHTRISAVATPRSLLPPPILVDDTIHQLRRERPSQQADRGPISHATRPPTHLKIHKRAAYRPCATLNDRHWG